MRCTVCDKDKEINQFQTYWHSTQQKMRTRKQCTECFYNNRLIIKDPEKYYQNNPNYKKCSTCSDWKLLSEYYQKNGKPYLNRCKECEKNLEREKRKEYIMNNCGGDKILTRPNKYSDEYQRACTFELMEALGYTFDEATGIWIKPGVKELVDGIPFFINLGKSSKIRNKITSMMIKQMLELYKSGWGYKRISDKIGCSQTSVFKYIKKLYNDDKIN